MKYIVLLCDGMADRPTALLGGGTPMERADKPCMDRLAAAGEVGMVRTVPAGMDPGSDVANLSVMGYDPHACYTGRSPLEAANLGIELADDDVAIRCNLVTLSGAPAYSARTMADYCAGDIHTREAAPLVRALQEALGGGEFDFYTGTAYRHCLVWKGGAAAGRLTPPHDISGQVIGGYLPDGEMAPLRELMERSVEVLAPFGGAANAIWLWGQGKRPRLDSFRELFGVDGAVISAVDLLKGIGRLAGLTVCEVEGATGYIDTSYENKTAAALEQLRQRDFVYIHVEAPDECGHRGQAPEKVRAIGDIDRRVLAPLCDALDEAGEAYRLLILPDHPTPLDLRTHTADPVPYLLYDSRRPASGAPVFTEAAAERAAGGVPVEPGHRLIRRLFEM